MTKLQEINGLTILGDGPVKIYPSGQKLGSYLLRCYCGKEFTSFKNNIHRGHTKSCGCKRGPSYHGDRGNPIYTRWDAMIQRCTNPKSNAYKNYGGRGITVCDEWRSYLIFREWAENSGFNPELELDRKDNNKGYCPDNCRWLTHSQNNRNKRDNYIIEYDGKSKTVTEWGEIYGIHPKTIQSRIKLLGWSIHDSLTKGHTTNKGKKYPFKPKNYNEEQRAQHSEKVKRGWIKRKLKNVC